MTLDPGSGDPPHFTPIRNGTRVRHIISEAEYGVRQSALRGIMSRARIADIGGAACVEAIAVGVPESEVALHATQAICARSGPSPTAG